MQYTTLGPTPIKVSVLCLGSMTWGEQNSQKEAHEQLDCAFERGINFIDTAEMYPCPPKKKTYTLTEQYIGRWEKMKTHRDDLVLATKIAGPGMDYIRGGGRFTRKHIEQAVEASLKRLGTDTIDLYQLHWPERKIDNNKVIDSKAGSKEEFTPFEEILETFDKIKKEGKVREFGLSNETPWGTMKFLETAQKHQRPKIVSIQNSYNLLNRGYEIGMAEISMRESCGLLAYSPLGFGTLTGKYLDGQQPKKSRITLWPEYDRYTGTEAILATKKYVEVARKYNLSVIHMALAFVRSRAFVTSAIIGATKLSQLEDNIDSLEITLSKEMEKDIENIHREISNPAL